MRSKTAWLVVVSALGLAACQSVSVPENASYNPQTQARVRLYGQNQKPTIMEYAYGQKRYRVNVGGSLGSAFSSLVGAAKSASIGIPQTRMVQEMSQYNGLMSKVYYQEFVIPADVPVRVHNSFIGLTTVNTDYASSTQRRNGGITRTTTRTKRVGYEGSCNGNDITFTPRAGQDYEVVPTRNSASCGVTVLQVDRSGGTDVLSFD